MTTWKDVERIHKLHPDWTSGDIGNALNCESAYVRATFARRGWVLSGRVGRPRKWARVAVQIDVLKPHCDYALGETPQQWLERVVKKAISQANGARR